MRTIAAFFCALFLAAPGLTQTGTAAYAGARSKPHGQPCLFDFERGEVPECVYSKPHGQRFVASRYLKQLPFDSYGLAAVHAADGWMYVNRRGRAIIIGVPTFDNGPDTFHDGLVRFVRNKKYGFANRKGEIVIPAVYDGAMTFENGRAQVCTGCEDKCAESECEHHYFSGGVWSSVNTKGAALSVEKTPGDQQVQKKPSH